MLASVVQQPRVGYLRLGVPGWTHPLRLAHLAGLCCGANSSLDLEVAAIDRVNEARPDLVVLTGDLVTRGRAGLSRLTSLLAGLERPAVAVLSRRDHLAGAVGVVWALERAGVHVLANERQRLAGLSVVGLDADAHVALATGAGRAPDLGLVADPALAPALWAHGVPLVLSGAARRDPTGWRSDPRGRGQLLCHPGLGSPGLHQPPARRVLILDVAPAAAAPPVERPWDFLAA